MRHNRLSVIDDIVGAFQVQVKPFRFKLKTGFLLSVQHEPIKPIHVPFMYVCRLKVIDRKRNELNMQLLYSTKSNFSLNLNGSVELSYWHKCEIIFVQGNAEDALKLYKMIYYHNKERLIFFISFSFMSFHVLFGILFSKALSQST